MNPSNTLTTILVTGSNGQLGSCFKAISNTSVLFRFIFQDSKNLDITNENHLNKVFEENDISFCVNCAAYTNVDLSEKEIDQATLVNTKGVENIAKACRAHKATLIHVSTDFVFDGLKNSAYSETDDTNPIGVYGSTKLAGEQIIPKHLQSYYIIRTSWLYSEFNANFMKTMLKLAEQKKDLGVVSDQIGTPTYAIDLSKAIMHIIGSNVKGYGVYHYANQGVTSWYDFAKAIFEISELDVKVRPIKSEQYPTPAKRPTFSVLDTQRITSVFNIEIPYWRDSLKRAIKALENEKN